MNYFIFLNFFWIFYSCDNTDCVNDNPIFEQYSIESIEYQKELVRQLQESNPDDLKFWLEGYTETGGKNYLRLKIHGRTICAVGLFLADGTYRVDQVLKNKGVGYSGARLLGVEYSFMPSNESEKALVLKNVRDIID
jgi:hypothetical protein